MRMLAPHEAKFLFSALCVRDLPGGKTEKSTFWYYLPDNDTEEARRDIAEEGWYIVESKCEASDGKAIHPNAIQQFTGRRFRRG